MSMLQLYCLDGFTSTINRAVDVQSNNAQYTVQLRQRMEDVAVVRTLLCDCRVQTILCICEDSLLNPKEA